MTTMTINSKQKGKRGELEFSHFLRDHGYSEARRGQQYNGLEGEDVIGLPGFHIEVKITERFNLYDALDQSIRDASEGVPIVAHRKNRREWVIVLQAEDFLKLIDNKRTTTDLGFA